MKVKSSEVAMEMKPEKDPEETPTPKELLKKLKFGTPQEFDAAIVHLHAPDTELSVFNKPKILKEKKAVKNV